MTSTSIPYFPHAPRQTGTERAALHWDYHLRFSIVPDERDGRPSATGDDGVPF
jgi:hypothetical protein